MGVHMFELRIEEPQPGTNLKLEVWESDSYPPGYLLGPDGLVPVVVRNKLDETALGFGYPDLLSGGTGIVPLAEAARDEIATELMVQQFLRQVQQQLIWESISEDVGRIVVVNSSSAARVEWENLQSAYPQVALLRRSKLDRPAVGAYLSFPISIGVTGSGGVLSLRESTLFDEYVGHAKEQGGVEWRNYDGNTDLLHLTLDKPRELASVLPFSMRVPRVVVVQITDPAVYQAVDALETTLLGAGVGAVVAASVTVADTNRFFQPFYRKLMHNWPLEYCAWAGAKGHWEDGAPMVRVTAFSGGEFGLALSRLPVERAAAQRHAPVPDGGEEPDGEWLRDFEAEADGGGTGDDFGLDDGGADDDFGLDDEGDWLGVEPPAGPVKRGFEEPIRGSWRERRAAEDVGRAFDAISRDELEPMLERATELRFDSERTDLQQILELTKEADKQSRGASTARAAVRSAPTAPRRTNVTVLDPETGEPVEAAVPLEAEHEYTMTVAIASLAGRAQVSEELDEAPLRAIFEKQDLVELDVVVFAPEEDFRVEPGRGKLALPRIGPTQDLAFTITPLRTDWCRLRVAVYFRNTMLQSLALEVYAGTPLGLDGPSVRPALDWVASTDLQLLAELPEPVFNVFLNEGLAGNYWMGVFSRDNEDALPLVNGQMRTFDSQEITTAVEELRRILRDVHGEEEYAYPGAEGPPTPELVKFGIEALLKLAPVGANVHDYLFDAATDFKKIERLDAQLAATQEMGGRLVSVARTHGHWTVPWAALYDLPLDPVLKSQHEVCSVFTGQLAANTWEAAASDLVGEPEDLLDDPAACRAQPNCPLNDDTKRRITVCPFGFWGFRHEIEQPLQNVDGAADDELPEEMQSADFSQSSFIVQQPGEQLRVAGAVYPFESRKVERDMKVLQDLFGDGFEWVEKRDKVIRLLESEAGHHLFYFYCHGRDDPPPFALEVGPAHNSENLIVSDSIDRQAMHWRDPNTPQPFVVLIACESLAMEPEKMNVMFGKFKNAGASGLVGSEIKIGVELGHEWGTALMAAIHDGRTAGEAFADLRKSLLRRYNPLGLVFTLYAPATLHIHPEDGCPTCTRIGVGRTAGEAPVNG